jgi:hypothetical protein
VYISGFTTTDGSPIIGSVYAFLRVPSLVSVGAQGGNAGLSALQFFEFWVGGRLIARCQIFPNDISVSGVNLFGPSWPEHFYLRDVLGVAGDRLFS